ncbi:hypothetical protein ATCC90586_010365 [Pythium insidiosum]|nr:hypothetical protein ATCC90586_010365 [Pythium insidiosum]
MAMASASKKAAATQREKAASDVSDAEMEHGVESGSGDDVEDSEQDDGDVNSGSDHEADGSDGEDSEGSVGDDDGADILQPEDDADDDDEEMEAVGFGDAMSKILQQNVADAAQPILAKRTTARMREIMNEKKEAKQERMSAAEKRAKERKDNVMPSHASAAKDRTLRKIATKGVVALFNAIAKHQHQVGKPTDKEDKKVKELSKESFLGLLKSAKNDKDSAASASKPEAAASTNKTWSVLQDDYMMGAKMKDWDAAHAPESARARRRADAKGRDDESDPEAVEDRAWKQAAALDSEDDEEQEASAPSKGKRKGAAASSKQSSGKKKTKKAKH